MNATQCLLSGQRAQGVSKSAPSRTVSVHLPNSVALPTPMPVSSTTKCQHSGLTRSLRVGAAWDWADSLSTELCRRCGDASWALHRWADEGLPPVVCISVMGGSPQSRAERVMSAVHKVVHVVSVPELYCSALPRPLAPGYCAEHTQRTQLHCNTETSALGSAN